MWEVPLQTHLQTVKFDRTRILSNIIVSSSLCFSEQTPLHDGVSFCVAVCVVPVCADVCACGSQRLMAHVLLYLSPYHPAPSPPHYYFIIINIITDRVFHGT